MDFVGMTNLELQQEIKRLQKECETKDLCVRLLRSQLRVLGHIPMVVEDEATGAYEYAFRSAARRAGAQ